MISKGLNTGVRVWLRIADQSRMKWGAGAGWQSGQGSFSLKNFFILFLLYQRAAFPLLYSQALHVNPAIMKNQELDILNTANDVLGRMEKVNERTLNLANNLSSGVKFFYRALKAFSLI